jgi:hypothetical protein
VIAKHSYDRQVHGGAKIDNQLLGFFGEPVIGEVTAEQEDIGLLRASGEEIVQGATGMLAVMDIGHRRDAQFVHSEIGNGCARGSGRDARKLRSIRVVPMR